MNFEKLKESARKYEQKEEWRRAIEVYLQAIQEFEAGHDPIPDLSIYNRIGDLYLKANEPGAAVQAYERAADLYRDQGFYNNAIALCGKILRVNPGRIGTYLKLAHLHARKNVVIDAKKNLLEYLERMNALGQLDEAFKALKDFAENFPGNKEIRLMLVELLRASSRTDEAREELEKLASDLEARGDTVGARRTLMKLQAMDLEESLPPADKPMLKNKSADLVFLDTGAEQPAARSAAARAPRKTTATRKPEPGGRATKSTASPGLPLIDVSGERVAPPAPPTPPLAIETSSLVGGPLDLEPTSAISDEARLEATASGDIARTLGFEPTEIDTAGAELVAPLEGLELDAPVSEPMDLLRSDLVIERSSGLDIERVDDDAAQGFEGEPPRISVPDVIRAEPLVGMAGQDPDLALDIEVEADSGLTLDAGALDLDLIEPEGQAVLPDGGGEVGGGFLDTEEPAGPSIADLEDQVLDDPDDPEPHRSLGEALIANGEALRGQEELELALAGYETREDWNKASGLIDELIRLEPNGVRYHQKRVEIGFRTGDRARLLDAYVELADALVRVGAVDKALAVYRRVAEHDPGNQRALTAIETLTPVEDLTEPPAPAPPPAPSAPAASPAAAPRRASGKTAAKPPRKSEPVPAAAAADDDSFVDLGALILDDEAPKDTRMKVGDDEPSGDEQRDFQDMLAQFRRGIDENIAAEDFQAHYDLGVAFKEMGLLDEAIAEFQKALRSPEGRLKTTEALGTAFYEKGQHAIAEAVLKRGVESLSAPDDSQIGLLYWLGRAQEAQSKVDQAVQNYERVLAVDIAFQDVSARMSSLAGRRK
jgi:tetratricopeptide (TPR) repeat protein